MARSNLSEAGTVSADGSTRLAPMPGSSAAPMVAARLPADFDAEGFSRIAKMIFIRMQAANDTGDLNDLRSFTTPEMFAAAKMDLQDRAGAAQTTDVVHVDAQVLDLVKEGERHTVSVRFHGQMPPALLTDQQVADVLNFVLTSWGNDRLLPEGHQPFTPEEIHKEREPVASPKQMAAERPRL